MGGPAAAAGPPAAIGAIVSSDRIAWIEAQAALVKLRRLVEAALVLGGFRLGEQLLDLAVIGAAERQQHLAVELAQVFAVAGVDRLGTLGMQRECGERG